MRIHLMVVAAGVLLATEARGTAAQGVNPADQHHVSIGFGGGMSVPVSDTRDAFKNGVNGQGFVLFRLGAGLPAIRLNVSYQKFDLNDALASATTSGSESRILGGVGGLSFDLLSGPVRPYIMAGVGAFNVKTTYTAGTSGASSPSDTDFGIDGGAGIALNIGAISAFAEGKLQNIYTKKGGAMQVKSIKSIPVTFGILIGL